MIIADRISIDSLSLHLFSDSLSSRHSSDADRVPDFPFALVKFCAANCTEQLLVAAKIALPKFWESVTELPSFAVSQKC